MVRVAYTKWDGAAHWQFDMERLGRDEYGVWLAGRPGTMLQRGAEPPIIKVDAFVLLVPDEGRWMAAWNAESEHEIYVDVTTAPAWSDGTVSAVDLDLDVVRMRDGAVILLDEDEFAEHRVLFAYPPSVVGAAEATAAWLMGQVAARVEPFGAVGARWLARVAEAVGDAVDREEEGPPQFGVGLIGAAEPGEE